MARTAKTVRLKNDPDILFPFFYIITVRVMKCKKKALSSKEEKALFLAADLYDNLIAAVCLAHIQLPVGLIKNLFHGRTEIVLFYADGYCDGKVNVTVMQRHFLDGKVEILHDNAGFINVHVGEKETELFTAPSAYRVSLLRRIPKQSG